ncbi:MULTISPECIES: RNA-binding S4 domain-containing protein [unclassified Gordonia (in: high G+C Gram-positive bacteria)]|uniref:RNA-binding S4 domain-containing protein n=1 Tax=Gordonia TaxID=2053 RepID=UPI0022492270|nr:MULTISPECIES: RNA-binding S4 domain-containing protein [unclassified Gordonia (in: high G+C Gram-positive bacteria)]MCX2755016.1 RNA-binding S4 domain-containing protein [Gordonia sp. 4N]MCZ4535226.1 RNA-binding S4 domain-containing protein [Gordonia terrae]MDT0222907.1 RNA-binding S4 domain-containing protein [Gordonia sp. AC31]
MIEAVYDVTIRDDSIRLGQFLKLANLIESGAEAKEVIADGLVTVNDEVETRRGRQLTIGDVVSVGGMSVRVVAEGDVPPAL